MPDSASSFKNKQSYFVGFQFLQVSVKLLTVCKATPINGLSPNLLHFMWKVSIGIKNFRWHKHEILFKTWSPNLLHFNLCLYDFELFFKAGCLMLHNCSSFFIFILLTRRKVTRRLYIGQAITSIYFRRAKILLSG